MTETETIPENDAEPKRASNPFGVSRREPGALVETTSQREVAEVQAAMTIAKRFPRDHIDATDRILQACTRTSLAEGALYSYSRGGSEITGPSIRLAEVAAQAWGNVACGVRELEQHGGQSTVEAYAWDLETNTRVNKVFQVKHVRSTKRGSYKIEDPRDIYEHVANQGARRLRACILAVIPGDVIEAAVNQCSLTLHASADTSPEGIRKVEETFAAYGVVKEQIEKRIQCRLESIRPAQVVQLRKIAVSLRDGMSTPADWFDPIEGSGGDADADAPVKPTLKDKVKKATAKSAKPAPVTDFIPCQACDGRGHSNPHDVESGCATCGGSGEVPSPVSASDLESAEGA